MTHRFRSDLLARWVVDAMARQRGDPSAQCSRYRRDAPMDHAQSGRAAAGRYATRRRDGFDIFCGGTGRVARTVDLVSAARPQFGQTNKWLMTVGAVSAERCHFISIWQLGQIGGSSCSSERFRVSTMRTCEDKQSLVETSKAAASQAAAWHSRYRRGFRFCPS